MTQKDHLISSSFLIEVQNYYWITIVTVTFTLYLTWHLHVNWNLCDTNDTTTKTNQCTGFCTLCKNWIGNSVGTWTFIIVNFCIQDVSIPKIVGTACGLLLHPAGKLDNSDICNGFTRFWQKFHNEHVWEFIFIMNCLRKNTF